MTHRIAVMGALVLVAALSGCAEHGQSRAALLGRCAERVGVKPPINFTWIGPYDILGNPGPGTEYVWDPGTEVSPFQQTEIDRCMRLLADRPML